MTLAHPPLLLSILEEHFVQLDTLWERREMCVFDPVWTQADLAELELRAQRHLDGLLLGQGHAADMARAALGGDERGAATAAAFLMWDLGEPELKDELIKSMAEAEPEVVHGIRLALRHREPGEAEAGLREMAGAESSVLRACVCDVLAFHRCDPVAGVRDLLKDGGDEVRALGIAAIGRWRGEWSAEDLREQLLDADCPLSQRAALETSARVILPELPEICLEAAFRSENCSLEALRFLGVVGDAGVLPRLEEAVENPLLAEAALDALGALGFPLGVPVIIKALADPMKAHAAAAAFLRITAAEDVDGEPVPAPEDLGEDEVDFWDEHVEVDPVLAERWWGENEGRFGSSERWQGGVVVSGWPVDEGCSLEIRRDVFLWACLQGATQDRELGLAGLS